MAFSKNDGNEPRNYFVTMLIQKLSELEYLIFVQRASVINVFPAMKGIIAMLNMESQKELYEIYETIEKWEKNQKRYTKADIEKIYGRLMGYLHTGYLKEVNWIKPRFEAKTLEFIREDNPEKQKS